MESKYLNQIRFFDFAQNDIKRYCQLNYYQDVTSTVVERSNQYKNWIRFLDCARKERSDGIASKQLRLVRASMTDIFIHLIFCHIERNAVESKYLNQMRPLHCGRGDIQIMSY